MLSTITHNGFNYNLTYDYGYLSGVYIGSRNLSTKDYSFSTGELYQSSYGNGWDTFYTYDKFGRLVWSGTFTSDDGSNNRQQYASTSYKYNKLGQLSEFYDSLTGITRTYDYDMAGRLTDSRSSDGSLDVSYTYDNQGRLKDKYYKGFNGVNQYYGFYYNSDGYLEYMYYDNLFLPATVDKFGRTTETRLIDLVINDLISTNTYTYASGNGANTTTTLVDTETIGNYGSVAYDYMPNGNIYWEYVTRNGTEYEIAYTYDDLGQLTEEDNFFTDQTVCYTYDSGGNITSRTTYDGVWWTRDDDSERTDTYTYGDAEWKDLLTAYNGHTITYDAIGNPTVYRRGESMTWSGGRKLTEIEFDEHGDLILFDYDNSGLRTRKEGPRVYDCNYAHTPMLFIIDYYYDDNGTLVYERRSESGDNASTYFTIEYFYGLNGITGFTVLNGTSSTTYYYLKNILGDVLGITDSNGTLVAEYRYDAYGKPVKILDGNGNDVSTNYAHIANINPIRYRGYYYDIETGFYYVSSRYYDPEIGRWINADGQISGVGGEILGYNMFAYCMNNPVNMSDPTGNWPKWATIALGAVAAVAAVAVTVVTLGAAAPAAACTLTAVGMSIGASYAVASTVATVAVAATTVAAAAYAGDIAYSAVTGDSLLLDTVFQGNTDAYNTGLAITSIATAGMLEAAAQSPGVCFVAGTPVLAACGYIAIEEIKAGDMVWAENPETGEKELKSVVQTFVNETTELIHVQVGSEKIVTTPEHPFYSPVKGWTAAYKLRAGDILVLQNGKYVTIEKVQHEILETPITVYNFEVADFHTYYVGQCAVLVHNTCGGKPTSPNQMQKQVERGQAPSTVVRVDNPKIPGQLPHIHFSDGTAMNIDGSVHDAMRGAHNLTNSERIWIFDNGWGD